MSPRPPRSIVLAAGGVVLCAVLGVVLLVGLGRGSQAAPGSRSVVVTQHAPRITAAGGSLLGLSVVSGKHGYRAPNFTLTDQHGRRVSLAQFRGKAVVLSFNDDQCPDLCTLLAQAVVVANRDLGAAAKRVVFLSVNVNPFYPQVRYVRSWSDEHHLGGQPNWYFGTGPVKELKAIWRRYGVYVGLDRKTRTVTHGTELFFVSPSGTERAIGAFGTNAASTTLYAHDLAQMAADLLPDAGRIHIGGPRTPAPAPANATVGARAPSFKLPVLGAPGRRLSSTSLRHRYALITFWSGACASCEKLLAHAEQAHEDLGDKVAMVAVDVADHGSGLGLARRAGATFPLVSDAARRLADAYRVSALPFTAVVGPSGKVLTRHVGSFTTQQIEYILQTDMSSRGG